VLATEIYIPVVHYASSEITPRIAEQQCDTPTTLTGDGDVPKSLAASSAQWQSYSPLFAPHPSSLSLSVNLSEGRYAIEGQTLKWWYGVPPPGAAEREYTITITRAGGAIKTLEEQEKARPGLWQQMWTCLRETCGAM